MKLFNKIYNTNILKHQNEPQIEFKILKLYYAFRNLNCREAAFLN